MRLRPPIVLMIHFFNYVLTSKRFINDVDIYKKKNIISFCSFCDFALLCICALLDIMSPFIVPNKNYILLVVWCR